MLTLGSQLIDTPVMSLQTGGKLATTIKPIIDPANLYIVAYEVSGPLLSQDPSFLRTLDIREISRLGLIIDSNDEIVGLSDVLKIEKLYNLAFSLVGLSVVDEKKRKIGKVSDYTFDPQSFVVQQLNVSRGIFRGLSDTGLLIHRSQITKIDNKQIVIKSASENIPTPVVENLRGEFVNPFRKMSEAPQVEPES